MLLDGNDCLFLPTLGEKIPVKSFYVELLPSSFFSAGCVSPARLPLPAVPLPIASRTKTIIDFSALESKPIFTFFETCPSSLLLLTDSSSTLCFLVRGRSVFEATSSKSWFRWRAVVEIRPSRPVFAPPFRISGLVWSLKVESLVGLWMWWRWFLGEVTEMHLLIHWSPVFVLVLQV